jgi:ATP-dependent Clp endopeptidase proteolytic subunit ClpP
MITEVAQPRRIFAAAKKNDTLELLIYDSIGESFWGGGVSAESVKQKLDEAGDVKKINVRINSPGGDVFEGSAIYSMLSQHKADVECYIDGLAASAAFTIAMAGKSVHISESAMMMCHNAWGMCMGYAADMAKTADVLNKVSTTMRDIYSAACGKTADEVQKLMDDETWMTPEESVALGFADDVIKREPDDDEQAKALAASYDLSKFKSKKPEAESAPPVAKPEPPAPEVPVAVKADDECMCDCAACMDDNCQGCTNADCEDPNCEDCPNQMKAAAALTEVEMMREQFAVLSI